jgi:hypothetical protein
MSHSREYEIAFVGLKPGEHNFSYEITDKFFEPFQQQDFKNCHAFVKLKLDKKTGFMLLKFDLDGRVELICDRCGNNLQLQLWDEFNIVVKIVDDPDIMNEREEDPDIYYVAKEKVTYIYQTGSMSLSTSVFQCKECVKKMK